MWNRWNRVIACSRVQSPQKNKRVLCYLCQHSADTDDRNACKYYEKRAKELCQNVCRRNMLSSMLPTKPRPAVHGWLEPTRAPVPVGASSAPTPESDTKPPASSSCASANQKRKNASPTHCTLYKICSFSLPTHLTFFYLLSAKYRWLKGAASTLK